MEQGDHTEDVTLTLRGERIPLRNTVSSVYNGPRHELLVVTSTALYLYGKMLTAGGDLLATLVAEENVHYQFALLLPWVSGLLLLLRMHLSIIVLLTTCIILTVGCLSL